MKLITIFGTRPEYIRLNILIRKIDDVIGKQNHILIDTEQNYDPTLRDYFYSNFNLRKPNYILGSRGTFAEQISNIFTKIERIISIKKPDKFLVLGDTNSSTAAFIAKRLGVDVYHIEAGNRCLNTKSPEEINRKLIDHISDIHMTYSYRSKENLIYEGIHPKNIFVVGNPIFEVLNFYRKSINCSKILQTLSLSSNEYILATMHRQENVDIKINLENILAAFSEISKLTKKKFVLIVHPRLKKRIKEFKINTYNLYLIKPLNFFDFILLQQNSNCIFTDSGTVQEESSILNKKCVVVRDSTERLETIESSNSLVSGLKTNNIIHAFLYVSKRSDNFNPPDDYLIKNFSDKALNILLSKKPL